MTCKGYDIQIKLISFVIIIITSLLYSEGFHKSSHFLEGSGEISSQLKGDFIDSIYQNNRYRFPAAPDLTNPDPSAGKIDYYVYFDTVSFESNALQHFMYEYYLDKPSIKTQRGQLLYEYGPGDHFGIGVFSSSFQANVTNYRLFDPMNLMMFVTMSNYYNAYSGTWAESFLEVYQNQSFLMGNMYKIAVNSERLYDLNTNGVHLSWHFLTGNSWDPYIRIYLGAGSSKYYKNIYQAGIAPGNRVFLADNLYLFAEASLSKYALIAKDLNIQDQFQFEIKEESSSFTNTSFSMGVGFHINLSQSNGKSDTIEYKSTMPEIYENLQDSANKFQLSYKKGEVRIRLPDSILFDSGKSELMKNGQLSLRQLSAKLAAIKGRIIIEGHTDNIPVSGSNYKSNQELGFQRAMSVMNLFIQNGIPFERISVTSYGDKKPIASNDTPEGRRKNRRIDIIIIEE